MRKKQLVDISEKMKFDKGFRVMNGTQEFVTYFEGTTLRVWYGEEPDYYSEHWHAAMEIALPIKGELQYIVQGRETAVGQGDVLLIPANVMHSLRTPPGSIRNLVLFDPAPFQNLREPARLHGLLSEPLLLTEGDEACGPVRETLFEMVRLYYDGKYPLNLLCYQYLFRVFALVLEGRSRDTAPGDGSPLEPDPMPEAVRQALNRVFDYVDARCAEKITLESAAQVAGFSKYYFSRIFSQYTHLSFSRYVLNKRIAAASRLLCDTDLKLLDVAVQSGFASLSTFNRVFRVHHGCTPTEFRALYKKDTRNE